MAILPKSDIRRFLYIESLFACRNFSIRSLGDKTYVIHNKRHYNCSPKI